MEVQIHIFDKHRKHVATEAVMYNWRIKEDLNALLRRTLNHTSRIMKEDNPDWGAIEIEIKR